MNGYVGNLIPHNHLDPNNKSREAIATRRAIDVLKANFTHDTEVKLAGCWLGKSESYMKDLSNALGCKVTGNTGIVAGTGAGTWMIAYPNKNNVERDPRWGAFPLPAQVADKLKNDHPKPPKNDNDLKK